MNYAMKEPRQGHYPGELSESDLDIIGREAVQLRIPMQHVAATLDHLRKLRMVTERAILILEASPIADDRGALFQVRSLFRGLAQTIGRVKRRRW